MISKVILNFILLSAALASCGCGAIHQAYEKQEIRLARLNHQDPLHIKSCGPEAIQDALLVLGTSISLNKISYDIQKRESKLRCFISIFDNEGREITWPWEIEGFFNKNDKINEFEASEVDNFKSLSNNAVAIILIRKKYSLRHYHWVTYPIYSKAVIKSFFEEDTKISKIYEIKRKK